jgi:diguanylate cyclase (GGDEF)-like protein
MGSSRGKSDKKERREDPLKTGEMVVLPLDELAKRAASGDAPRVPPARGETSSSEMPVPKSSSGKLRQAQAQRETGPRPSSPSWSGGPPSSDQWTKEELATDRITEKSLTVPAPPALRVRGTLTVLTGLNAGQVFSLDSAEHVIGRGTEADIWIEDSGLSRKHARVIRRDDGVYAIEDMGSTNGTFIGSRRVDFCDLQTGDRVQLGPNTILRFMLSDDAEEALQKRLYESSTRDALTRAFNRKYFNERLVAEVAHAKRHKVKLALLMIDVDRFKQTNDTHGHLVGDMVLRMVAAQIQRLIRVDDLLARFGGEEFALLARSTGKRECTFLAERIRRAIEGLEIPTRDGPLRVTASLGVASLSDLGANAGPTELLDLADKRLYKAKANGRNRVCAED